MSVYGVVILSLACGIVAVFLLRRICANSPLLNEPARKGRLESVGAEVIASHGTPIDPFEADAPVADTATASEHQAQALSNTVTATKAEGDKRAALLDAAVPGGLAFTAGAIQWLTPDSAAMAALSHVTGENITNAFDFHRTLSAHQYQLLHQGSLLNWRGHVGEAQVAEQVEWLIRIGGVAVA